MGIFLQIFNYVFKKQFSAKKIVVDTLNTKIHLLTISTFSIISFATLPNQHVQDVDFKDIWVKCKENKPIRKFFLLNGFLFIHNQLYIPHTSLRNHLIQDLHVRGLAAHIKRDKTLTLLQERFYMPYMRRDVTKFVQRCTI